MLADQCGASRSRAPAALAMLASESAQPVPRTRALRLNES
jgi:hypothetical protein